MKRSVRCGLAALLLALGACTTEDELPTNKDLTVGADLVAANDLGPDLAVTADDLPPLADLLPTGDLASDDLPSDDLANRDLTSADLFSADLARPDLFTPDLLQPDLFDPTDLLGVQSGEVCNNATVLTLTANTVTRSGDTTVGYVSDYNVGAFCTGTVGPDRVYRITVPGAQKLTVTVTPTAPYNPSLNLALASACGVLPRDCLLGVNDGGGGGAETAVWTNGSANPIDLVIVIESASASGSASAGTFDLTATVSDLPSGEVCLNATTVSSPSMAGQTTVGFTSEYGASNFCVGSSAGDHVYALAVPDQQRLSAKVTAGAGFDAAVNILTAAGCNAFPLECLAGDDSGAAAGVDTAVWTNTTGSSTDVLVIVDGSSISQSGTFTLDTTLTAALPGEACGNATVITAGALTGQTTVGYSAEHRQVNIANNCVAMMGPDRVYAIDVDAGKTLTATVTPTTPDAVFDVAINLFASKDACQTSPFVCGGSADSGAEGALDTAMYINGTGSKQTVYVVVGSAYVPPDPFATGTFRLDTTITP